MTAQAVSPAVTEARGARPRLPWTEPTRWVPSSPVTQACRLGSVTTWTAGRGRGSATTGSGTATCPRYRSPGWLTRACPRG